MSKKKKLKKKQNIVSKKRIVPNSSLNHTKSVSSSGVNIRQKVIIESSLTDKPPKPLDPSLQAALEAMPTIKEVATDTFVGTNKYLGKKVHRFVHNKLAESGRDNAGIDAFHKVEHVGENLAKSAVKSGVKTVKETINEHNLKKADIVNLKAKYGDNLTIKQLVDRANEDIFKPQGVSQDAPVLRSSKLKHASPARASVISLGSTVSVKEGATLLGKTVKSGTKGLKFASSNVSCAIKNKYHQAMKENTGLEAVSAAVDVTSVPTKYTMKKAGKVAYAAASKSAPARAWVAARQKARNFIARQQMKFLSKHKGIATVRGGAMKIKAIIKALLKELILKSKPVIVIFALIFLAILLFQTVIAPIISIFKAGSEQIIMSTYPTDNATITDSTGQWKDLEVELLQRIENIENEYPDYDEYIYDVDQMEHDPFELMAFLSAMNIDYSHPDVEQQIAEIFKQQNTLELIENIETRTDSEGEDYEYKILTVRLKPKKFIDVVTPILENAQKKDMFDLYMDSGGGRQMFSSPFIDDWRTKVSYHYGSRGSPTGVGYDFHTGTDFAYPAGTPILSVQNGVVATSGWHDLYGNYIVIRDAENNSSLYAHCTTLNVQSGTIVRKGQPIATVGTTGNSTGNHLHLEIKVRGERVNPVFYIGSPGSESEEKQEEN